jgi:adenine/guanine phosphoribosyltransferase-like PRPP-binding protein
MIYDSCSFDNLEYVVHRTCKRLRQHLDEFDVIVAQGMSGITVAAPVALRLKKPLVLVRKPDEMKSCHSSAVVIGSHELLRPGCRWLFLDDLISMGNTRSRCADAVDHAGSLFFDKPAYAGSYLYETDVWEARDN